LSDEAIVREGEQQLAGRRSYARLCYDMCWKSSENENPPPPWRRHKQGTKQDDVRGPERRTNSVRKSANQEGELGSKIISNSDDDRIADCPGEVVSAEAIVPLSRRQCGNKEIHRPTPRPGTLLFS